MKLTHRSEYALLALIHMARRGPQEYHTSASIAAAQGIPEKFLCQLLLVLKRAGCVHSRKGHEGGYRLAKPPEKIKLSAIVRLFDGALAPTGSVSRYFYVSTPIERERGLVRVFREIRDMVAHKLENTTLADVK
jgi:Rrf2 family protein